MKKPAFGGRGSLVACNPILAPSCLVVDAATSHLHLDLLHKILWPILTYIIVSIMDAQPIMKKLEFIQHSPQQTVR